MYLALFDLLKHDHHFPDCAGEKKDKTAMLVGMTDASWPFAQKYQG